MNWPKGKNKYVVRNLTDLEDSYFVLFEDAYYFFLAQSFFHPLKEYELEAINGGKIRKARF